MIKTARFWLMATMVLGAAAMRILPHPPNFAPIAAMALFSGACFDRKLWAFLVPLTAMLFSDAILELQFGWGFHSQMPVVYLTFAMVVGMGLWLRTRRRMVPVIGMTLAASTLFFVTTNFSVWAMGSMYSHTPGGLAACFAAAIPFFGSTVAGDLFYVSVLFGALALAERRFPIFASLQTAP